MKIRYLLILFGFHLFNCQAAAIKQPQLTDKEVQLFEAIYSNNVPKIKKLIDEGVNVNIISSEDESEDERFGPQPTIFLHPGEAPLNFAMKNPSFQTIKLLVDANANINAKTGHDETALHTLIENSELAIAKGEFLEIIKYLLERGSDPFIVGAANMTAFQRMDQKIEWLKKRERYEIEPVKYNEDLPPKLLSIILGYIQGSWQYSKDRKQLLEAAELLKNHKQIRQEYEKKVAESTGQELELLVLPPEVAAVAQSYLAAGDWGRNIKRKTQGPPGGPAMDLTED